MKQITTKDGSITYHNEKYDESYHSISGAIEEAIHKHAKPSGLLEYVSPSITLLDFCFGLGYNTIAALSLLGFKYYSGRIIIYALENDIEIMKKIPDLDYKELEHSSLTVKEAVKRFLETKQEIIHYKDIEFHFLLGDAVSEIERVPKNIIDVVFFDPFSPKKQPELWSKDVFSKIYDSMKRDSVLTTYSCATVIRENMKQVGFEIKDGPSVGRKSPSTIAYKK